MAFDGNGTFIRIMNWVADAAASIDIKADRHDQQDDDYAAGLSNVICKDGQSQPTANIPMNGKRIVNLGDPVNPQDAATRAFALAVKTFSTGMEISGADVNGQIRFSSPTGANGLSFTGADLSWIARLATAAGPGTPPVPPATLNRLVLNDKPDGSGADIFTINDNGTTLAGGDITSKGNVYSASIFGIKPLSGNGHVWWYAADGTTTRMILYTDSGAQGPGNLTVGGSNFAFGADGQFYAPSNVRAASAILGTDGNVSGSVWDQWGAHDAISAISGHIESRAQAWANDRVSQLQYRRTSQGSTSFGSGRQTIISPAGTVQNGVSAMNNNIDTVYYIYLQVYDPVRGWVGFQG